MIIDNESIAAIRARRDALQDTDNYILAQREFDRHALEDINALLVALDERDSEIAVMDRERKTNDER